LVGFFIILTHC